MKQTRRYGINGCAGAEVCFDNLPGNAGLPGSIRRPRGAFYYLLCKNNIKTALPSECGKAVVM